MPLSSVEKTKYTQMIVKASAIVLPEKPIETGKIEDEKYVSDYLETSGKKSKKIAGANFLLTLLTLFILLQNGKKFTVEKIIKRLINIGVPIFTSIRTADLVFRLVKYLPLILAYGIQAGDFEHITVKQWIALGKELDKLIAQDLLHFRSVASLVFFQLGEKKFEKSNVSDKKKYINNILEKYEKDGNFSESFLTSLRAGRTKLLLNLISHRTDEINAQVQEHQDKIKQLNNEKNEMDKIQALNDVVGDIGIATDSISTSADFKKLAESTAKLVSVNDGDGGAQRIAQYLSHQVVSKTLECAIGYHIIRQTFGQANLNKLYSLVRDVSLKLNTQEVQLINAENPMKLLREVEGQLNGMNLNLNTENVQDPVIEEPDEEFDNGNLKKNYSILGFKLDILYKSLQKTDIEKIKKLLKENIFKTGLHSAKNKCINDAFKHTFFGNDHQSMSLYQILEWLEDEFEKKGWM